MRATYTTVLRRERPAPHGAPAMKPQGSLVA